MALFDLYQVKDVQRYLGQLMLNLYFFQVQSAVSAPVAIDMANAFIGELLPWVLDLQLPAVTHESIEVQNLFDPSDRHVETISEVGTFSGSDELPVYDSIGFSLIQNNGAVKNGAKRYGGLSETSNLNGVLSGSGILTALTALEPKLSQTLNEGIIPTYVPCIVKRILIGSEYTLPTSLADATIGYITDAVYHPLITSQVSRKIGNGA